MIQVSILKTTVHSQIIPDNSLGDESTTVTPNQNINDLPSDLIEGGAQRGENLFYSFSQFSIEAGRIYLLVKQPCFWQQNLPETT